MPRNIEESIVCQLKSRGKKRSFFFIVSKEIDGRILSPEILFGITVESDK